MGWPAEAVNGFKTQMSEAVPLKRLGQTREIARTVLFLASEDSSFIVGSDVAVDGGITQL
jgi:NAD(P)-dependent dehydrogenase (short-subunit alcohol dehydrogenase family)